MWEYIWNFGYRITAASNRNLENAKLYVDCHVIWKVAHKKMPIYFKICGQYAIICDVRMVANGLHTLCQYHTMLRLGWLAHSLPTRCCVLHICASTYFVEFCFA